MKSDQEIIVESMAARIRELEGELETEKKNRHEEHEEKYQFNSCVKIFFSEFIIKSSGKDPKLLDFEKYIEAKIAESNVVDPALFEVYLWVFEGLVDNDRLSNERSGLNPEDIERITINTEAYRSQLRHWEKTGEDIMKK